MSDTPPNGAPTREQFEEAHRQRLGDRVDQLEDPHHRGHADEQRYDDEEPGDEAAAQPRHGQAVLEPAASPRDEPRGGRRRHGKAVAGESRQ